jgi:hypothetical protein
MVDPEIEGQIERGLVAGQVSHRRLAAELGISRGTVNAMAARTRPMDLSRRRALKRNPDLPLLSVGHCGRCGRRIELPCRACRDELALQGSGVRGDGSGVKDLESGPLTIALRDEDAERYLRLRHQKEREFLEQVVDGAEGRAGEEDDGRLPTTRELDQIRQEAMGLLDD